MITNKYTIPCTISYSDTYEMISGHRRMHAAKLAGLEKIPTIIREMTDDEAVICMVDANVQREELLPSEKAFAYKMKMEAMKRQGSRGDLTSCHFGTKFRTDQLIASEVGESPRTHHDDMRQVDEIVNLIVETVMCKNDKILIASNWYPAALVKKKFLMLTYSHIEYVLHCMSGNTSKVKNIKKYLLAALFNAPSTMNGYYQAEVNHDMPGLVR